MTISDLQKRENFYDINNKTLEKYFFEINRLTHHVRIYGSNDTFSIYKSYFFVYPKINAIVTKDNSEEVRKYIFKEFSNNPNLLKRFAIYLYTRLLLKSRGIFSDRCISIEPKIKGENSLLIFPGNKKIKIFNFKENYIDNIVKESFIDYCFNRELDFRLNNTKYDFVLGVERYSNRWYREKIIDGVSLPRISDKNKHKLFKEKVSVLLDLLQEDTKTEIKVGEHVNTLVSKIKKESRKLENKSEKFNFERNLEKFVMCLINMIANKKDIILLSLSHGDMQEGNVIIRRVDDKIFIVDWETWDERTIWYDKLMFNYNLRNIYKFIDNLKKYLSNYKNVICEDKNDISTADLNQRKVIVIIFILEDLLWQIKESNNFPHDIVSNSVEKYFSKSFQREIVDLLV
jgi:hypothetical protein